MHDGCLLLLLLDANKNGKMMRRIMPIFDIQENLSENKKKRKPFLKGKCIFWS